MQVKKTKTGKISMRLDLIERTKLYHMLCNFLESESPTIQRTKLEKYNDVTLKLYYYTLNELLIGMSFKLESAEEKKIVIPTSQALASLWMLRDVDEDMTLILIKSGLHKILS